MKRAHTITDDLSEISETDTARTGSTSGKSYFSENREEIYAILGLTEQDEIFSERFRIDRKKMEALILNDNETLEATHSFFQRVMEHSGTYVTWPSRLKIGAKSKKDPYVRVTGSSQVRVRVARAEILANLGIDNTQVTLRLNVSYTHHSHIIGEGGLTISKVRQETGCHIHFPDSNRTNVEYKSNQVSISGPIQGVEIARAKVRELIPLTFSFEPPLTGNTQSMPVNITTFIDNLTKKYRVIVQQKKRSRFNATLVIVKGSERDLDLVKEATIRLIDHICGDLADSVVVHMNMEITAMHHEVVKGPHNQYLRMIMANTNTHIMFLDANDPNIADLKKSSVTITGQIDNVYLARQQLMGSLPIYLLFNVPEDKFLITNQEINDLEDELDVGITVRKCPKQNSFSIMVKGVERNVGGLYEARKKILNTDDVFPVNIPSTYFIPNPPKIFNKKDRSPTPAPNFPVQAAPILSPVSPMKTPTLIIPPIYNTYWAPPFSAWNSVVTPQQLMMPRSAPAGTVINNDLTPSSNGFCSLNVNNLCPVSENSGWFSSLSSITSPLSTPTVSPRNQSPTTTTVKNADLSRGLTEMLKMNTDWQRKCPPGFENLQQSNIFPSDYNYRQMEAVKILESPVDCSNIRIPTSAWSGYGFSNTTPSTNRPMREQKLQEIFQQDCIDENNLDGWNGSENLCPPNFDPTSFLSASNSLEASFKSITDRIPRGVNDLSTLLISIGLGKYIETFKQQEIDFPTFLTLSNSNLQEIGIQAYGPRHKLLVVIAELKKRKAPIISAAPGAERERNRKL